MLIHEKHKKAIADAFYDKVISILGTTTVTETNGAVRKNTSAVVGTFKGNVRYTNFTQIKEQFGIGYEINVAISTLTDTAVQTGDAIEYAGVKYRVADVFPFDSHKLIVGQKWQVRG